MKLKVTSSSELFTALHKLACLEDAYDKRKYDRPLSGPVDMEQLHSLMKGLTASLQIQAMKNIETIERTIVRNAQEHVMMWTELLMALNAHRLQFGFGSPRDRNSGGRQSGGSHTDKAVGMRKHVHATTGFLSGTGSPIYPRGDTWGGTNTNRVTGNPNSHNPQ